MIVICRFEQREDGYGCAYAFVPKGSPGHVLNDDWDALGMRASGSHSMEFHDCFVPDELFNPQPGPWGEFDAGLLLIQISQNLALSAAMVGIAEHARDLVAHQVTS